MEERSRRNDPYARDSDKEYAPLEADRVGGTKRGRRGDDEGVEMAPDATLLAGDNEDDPEEAYESPEETARRERTLDAMLDDAVNRDPEALAADEALIHSGEPAGDLTPKARRAFYRTVDLSPDDLDDEDLAE
jgi:hypothetical protein